MVKIGDRSRACFACAAAVALSCAVAADVELAFDVKSSSVDGDAGYEFGSFGDAGLTVVRVWLSGLEVGDRVDAIVGTPDSPVTIATTDPKGFYNALLLGSEMPNPDEFDESPDLQWDTWVAINDATLFLLPSFPNVATWGGGDNVNESTTIGWLVVGGVVTDSGEVLIGQFAFGEGHDFEMIVNAQVNRAGQPLFFEGLELVLQGDNGEPDEGACCVEGDCFLMTQEDCDLLGGDFNGESDSCDGIRCDGPPADEGACCTGGECVVLTEVQCDLVGGTFNLKSATCDGVTCKEPSDEAACCIAGMCVLMSEGDCTGIGGVFDGSATCDKVVCESGACCIGDDCVMLPEGDCLTFGGTFDGAESCELSDCKGKGGGGNGEGACCAFDECFVDTAEICGLVGGAFGGAGTTCGDIACGDDPPSDGACCIDDMCFVMSEETCALSGGEFDGSTDSCVGVECAEPKPDGVCCLLGACVPISERDCASLDGTFHADAFSCADVFCDPTLGACCINGAAIDITEAQCAIVSGEFHGKGVPASTVACDVPPPLQCPGDVNGDGIVDLDDLIQVLADMECECYGDCTGKKCGSDGCGDSCGQCPNGFTCVDGNCLPYDIAKHLLGGGK